MKKRCNCLTYCTVSGLTFPPAPLCSRQPVRSETFDRPSRAPSFFGHPARLVSGRFSTEVACPFPNSACPTRFVPRSTRPATPPPPRSRPRPSPTCSRGRDVLGIAQTGTGKTAAFTLPMIDHAGGRPRQGAHAAHADPRADARTRRPGRRKLREVRPRAEAHQGAADRRRLVRRPGHEARPRRRRADRHARPPARPLRARQAAADRRADPGGRRSRPHARHGLHPGHRAHLQADPVQAARRCSSRPPCRRRSAASPSSS